MSCVSETPNMRKRKREVSDSNPPKKRKVYVVSEEEDVRNQLQIAAWHGRTEIVQDLIDNRNANPDDGFASAAVRDHTDVIALLIEKGADVNKVTVTGSYAIENAAMFGHHDVVELLVRKGSNFYDALYHASKNYDEKRKKRSLDTIHFLLQKGVDVNATVGRRSALHEAVMNGFVDAVNVLIQYVVFVRDVRARSARILSISLVTLRTVK